MSSHAHRSFVSYIDKSRQYYAARGFEQPYRWAFNDDVPFTPLPKPLADCRIGLGTTAGLGARRGDRDGRLFFAAPEQVPSLITDVFWDRDATHTDDPDSFLPLRALNATVTSGRTGSASPHFYGIPTDYSQRRTMEEAAPQIEQWMRDDNVDVAVLSPL
jgi:hypothetical protein